MKRYQHDLAALVNVNANAKCCVSQGSKEGTLHALSDTVLEKVEMTCQGRYCGTFRAWSGSIAIAPQLRWAGGDGSGWLVRRGQCHSIHLISHLSLSTHTGAEHSSSSGGRQHPRKKEGKGTAQSSHRLAAPFPRGPPMASPSDRSSSPKLGPNPSSSTSSQATLTARTRKASSNSLASLPNLLSQPPALRPAAAAGANVALDLSPASAAGSPSSLSGARAVQGTVARQDELAAQAGGGAPGTSVGADKVWRSSAARRAEKAWALQTEKGAYRRGAMSSSLGIVARAGFFLPLGACPLSHVFR